MPAVKRASRRCHFYLTYEASDSASMSSNAKRTDIRQWEIMVRSTLLLFRDRGGSPGAFQNFDELVVSRCLNLKIWRNASCKESKAEDAIFIWHMRLQILRVWVQMQSELTFANEKEWCEALSFFFEIEAALRELFRISTSEYVSSGPQTGLCKHLSE